MNKARPVKRLSDVKRSNKPLENWPAIMKEYVSALPVPDNWEDNCAVYLRAKRELSTIIPESAYDFMCEVLREKLG